MSKNTSSSGTPIDPSQNPADPYYIHPDENPTVALVTPLLNNDNYPTWAKLMKKALISKNKFKFCDGSFPPPNKSDPSYNAWKRCNNLIHSWIINSVSSSIAHTIIYEKLAANVWIDLKERFSNGNLLCVAELQEELYSFKQESLSVVDFYTELKVLWETFINYRPLPSCRCSVQCTCIATSYTRKYRDQDYVIRFLMGLNENFAPIKSQILLTRPLPTMNQVFSMVLQYERRNGLAPSGKENQVMVNAIIDGSYGRGRDDFNGRICTFCGKFGHTSGFCYRKNGFPPSFNDEVRTISIGRFVNPE